MLCNLCSVKRLVFAEGAGGRRSESASQSAGRNVRKSRPPEVLPLRPLLGRSGDLQLYYTSAWRCSVNGASGVDNGGKDCLLIRAHLV